MLKPNYTWNSPGEPGEEGWLGLSVILWEQTTRSGAAVLGKCQMGCVM